MSGKSGVKYDAVPKDESDQNKADYGATDKVTVNVTEEKVNANPFSKSGNYSGNLNGNSQFETNGKEYLKATETSFSQAVRIFINQESCYSFSYSESLSC